MKQKILVIGSNSFSGSDFIDLLLENENNEIIGISRSPEKSSLFLPYKNIKNRKFHFYQIDLNTQHKKLFQLLNRIQPSHIVNFAAQSEVAPSWEHPEQWFETNAVAVARLGNFLKDAKYLKRYMHISSPEVYGTCEGKITEDALLNPSTPYAASKAAGDLFLFTLVKNFNFPLVMIRATNVYGPHQQLFKIIPRTIIAIKSGKKVSLHGGGTAVKSYIHIRDVSRGEYAALLHGKNGQIYHYSPAQGISVKNVVELICKKIQVSFTKIAQNTKERLGQDKAYVIDSTKARQELNWQPRVTLSEGITEVVNWINTNWDTIKDLPHEYIYQP